MDRRCRSGLGIALLALAAVLALAAAWYLRLDEGQQRHVRNLVRQVPALPARYSV